MRWMWLGVVDRRRPLRRDRRRPADRRATAPPARAGAARDGHRARRRRDGHLDDRLDAPPRPGPEGRARGAGRRTRWPRARPPRSSAWPSSQCCARASRPRCSCSPRSSSRPDPAAGIGAVLGIVARGRSSATGSTAAACTSTCASSSASPGVVLVLVAAGLLATALHTAHEAGWFNALPGPGPRPAVAGAGRHGRSPRCSPGCSASSPQPTVGEVHRLARLRRPDDVLRVPAAASRARAPIRGRRDRARPRLLREEHTRWAAPDSFAPSPSRRPREPWPRCAARTGRRGRSRSHGQGARSPTPGCPAKLTVAAGPTTFKVTNDGADDVTEFEVLDRAATSSARSRTSRPGSTASFSLTLEAGQLHDQLPRRRPLARASSSSPARTAAALTPGGQGRGRARTARTSSTRPNQLVTAHADVRRRRERRRRRRGQGRVRARPAPRTSASSRSPRRFGDLDPRIDARAGDVPAKKWSGFHQIEQALWWTSTTDGHGPGRGPAVADVDAAPDARARRAARAGADRERRGRAAQRGRRARRSPVRRSATRTSTSSTSQANVEGSQAAFDAVAPAARRASTRRSRRTIDARFAAVTTALAPYQQGDGFVLYTALTRADTRGARPRRSTRWPSRSRRSPSKSSREPSDAAGRVHAGGRSARRATAGGLRGRGAGAVSPGSWSSDRAGRDRRRRRPRGRRAASSVLRHRTRPGIATPAQDRLLFARVRRRHAGRDRRARAAADLERRGRAPDRGRAGRARIGAATRAGAAGRHRRGARPAARRPHDHVRLRPRRCSTQRRRRPLRARVAAARRRSSTCPRSPGDELDPARSRRRPLRAGVRRRPAGRLPRHPQPDAASARAPRCCAGRQLGFGRTSTTSHEPGDAAQPDGLQGRHQQPHTARTTRTDRRARLGRRHGRARRGCAAAPTSSPAASGC